MTIPSDDIFECELDRTDRDTITVVSRVVIEIESYFSIEIIDTTDTEML